MNTYQGGRTSRGEWFQLNVITNLVWNFFSSGVFHSRICCSLFRTAFFLDKLFLHTCSQWWKNCFCGIVDQRKAFSLISSRDHCQRSSPSRISDMPQAGFQPAQNLSSGLVEWSCAVVITTTPLLRYNSYFFGTYIFLSSCFFWGAPFSEQSPICSSYFFRIATFSEGNLYRAATSWE